MADDVDVLVVGGGLAGMAAALEASASGASVVLAWAGEGSSDRAQGGVAAAMGGDDSPTLHAEDTIAAGAGLTDPAAARLLTGEGPGAVAWLIAHGVRFDEGLALEAAHARHRVVHAGGDRTGAAIVAALRERRDGVRLLDGVWLAGLLRDAGGVRGARFVSGDGRGVEVRAGATVLATGGYAGLYPRTVAPAWCDGAGLGFALLAGAELADLEFVQFHPTAYAGEGRPFLLTEALRGAGAVVTDVRGRRFLFDADPRGELAPRAVVTRAISERLRETGEDRVLLDARGLAERELAVHFAGFVANCARVGLDPRREPVPIAPAAHFTMGGVVTDAWGRTSVPGLLAAGECARTGVHGANRLASNSLLEAVVFGRRAGRSAAAAGRERVGGDGGDGASLAVAAPPGGGRLSVADVGEALRAAAGPLRDGPGLWRAQAVLDAGRGDSPHAEAVRLLARLVVDAALSRDESRGAHVRTDHPTAVDEWARWDQIATLSGIALRTRPGERGALAAGA